jgi:hypothetical protein
MAETVPQLLTRLTAAFETVPPEPWITARAQNVRSPAFLLGFPRSGTTLLGVILASRPDTAVIEEKPLLDAAVAEYAHAEDGPAKLAAASEADLERHRAEFWQRVERYGSDTAGKLVIDQMPLNSVNLPVIRRVFPDAPIIFALRDPRDVVFSCFRRLFAPNRFMLEFYALDSAANLYDATMRLADIARSRLGVQTFDIKNETLIGDFDAETKRLCRYLDLPWDESVRDFHKAARDRTLVTRSATQVRRGLNRDGVGAWRRYEEEMAPVLPILEPWVKRFGYEPAL